MKILRLLVIVAFIFGGCDYEPSVNPNAEHSGLGIKKYSGDLAVKWNRLQMSINRAMGIAPGTATRVFAYSGLTLYESVVKGIPGYHSVASELIGQDITYRPDFPIVYWPASGNAAMATALRSFIPTVNAASKARIDSIEQAFNEEFKNEVPQKVLDNSIDYGKRIAEQIFEWSKSDGYVEALAKNSSYVIPAGPGLWQPTPPAFLFPINVFAGEIRTFIKNSPSITMAPPPIPYSEVVNSDFYNQVKYVYDYSQQLTPDEITIVKNWGEFPGHFTNAYHYIMIAIQLIDETDLPLDKAAIAFAKHNMAVYEGITCVFVSKYTYNVVRPITYIRGVMGYSSWSAVNVTPAHPEYPAAHAVGGRASSRIMEITFGKDYSFTDKTHQSLYAARSYSSPEAYSDESGWSRVLGGIHYVPSVAAGKKQGEQVADLINDLFGTGLK